MTDIKHRIIAALLALCLLAADAEAVERVVAGLSVRLK